MKFFLTLILGCFGLMSFRVEDYAFVRFSQNEGLKHSQLLDISQDGNGNLWLGTTTRSIYRFDGKTFYEYKIHLPDNQSMITYKVQVDDRNRIWVLSNRGLIYFNGKKSVIIPSSEAIEAGTQSELLIDDEDSPWVIDKTGKVFQFENDSLIARNDILRSIGGKVKGFFRNEENRICFYSGKGEIAEIDKGKKINLNKAPWSAIGEVYKIYKSKQTYAIASSTGLYQYSIARHQLEKIDVSFSYYDIDQLIIDKEGVIWLLSASQAYLVDLRGKLHSVSGSHELMKNDVICLFQDNEGEMWFSVDVVGILKYKKQTWTKLSQTRGVDITSISENPNDHRLIFGTYGNGVLDGNRNYLKEEVITCLDWKSNGNLLAGTLKHGLFEIERKTEKSLPLDDARNEDVYGVRVWDDQIMAGGQMGLFIIDQQGKKKKYESRINGKITGASNPFVIDGTPYFTGMTSGLMKISGDSIVNAGPSFLKDNTVYTVKKQRNGGYLLTGEFSQLLFFDKKFNLEKTINLNAFVSNILFAELIDSSHVVVGSNDGLLKVTLIKDSISSVKRYGKVDGYEDDEVYVGASLVTQNNELVIGTVDGAYKYLIGSEESYSGIPSTYITNVEFRSPDSNLERQGYFQLPSSPQLQHDENSITFSFSATSLSNPYNIQFHYQLEGIQKKWSSVGSSQQITYSSLPPGEYTFRVQAISENKVWGSIARYSFSITPAFWQTNSFYVLIIFLAVLFTVLTTFFLSAYRIRQHKMREELRVAESVRIKKQMSMDFHDEMGNKLAGMLAQASLLKSRQQSEELIKVFDFFEKNAYAIYHGTKDFIWTIDINSNNLREVISYLRDFGSGFFERNNIVFHVEDDILDEEFDKQLPDGFNRHIILIFKEAMTNSLRHSGASNVFFFVRSSGATIEMALKDDGVWKENSKNGNGLRNMNTRAVKLAGNLVMKNENGLSEIILSFKI